MAAKTGCDSIYIDGMEGGTAAPHIATEETGVPGIAQFVKHEMQLMMLV
jgi:glutamate synthase domain-containing protein 2